MPMLRGLRGVIAFLTIMPTGGKGVDHKDAANNMYLFPVVGAGLGLCVGLLARGLLLFLPTAMIATTLTVAVLYLASGLHHFDGLIDFGDGLMLRGSPAEKIAAMRDKTTGAGGLGLGLVNTLLLVSCLGATTAERIVPVMVVSESSAKLAMVAAAAAGRPALDGVGAVFVRASKGRRGRASLLVGLLFSALTGVFALGMGGLSGFVTAICVALIIAGSSHRNFGCVTGDVLGATNELARSCSLLALVIFHWL